MMSNMRHSRRRMAMNPVRDHCHLTGQYRGAAHSCCNLQCQAPDFYPVIIHNLSGFDAHLFIKELKGKIRCIPTTDEKYISFTREVVVGEYTDKTGKKVASYAISDSSIVIDSCQPLLVHC
jgi:hypothetical protein